METKILQGNRIQERIFLQVKTETDALQRESGARPGIAFISFEGVPIAKYTIPLHLKVASDCGFSIHHEHLPADVPFDVVCAVIDHFNEHHDVHSIVILQPVPEHLNPMLVEERISPDKEVEGFHPLNMMSAMVPELPARPFSMCLPEALSEIFREEGVAIGPDDAWVFLMDDGFLGNPLTRMIVRAAASRVVPNGAPLTFISRSSPTMEEYCRRADFLVVVSKTPCFVKKEWLKPGVNIIDIYSNLVKEVPSKNDPSRMVPVIRGGVGLEEVQGTAASILPVPGGLMTVVLALLMRNTVMACRMRLPEAVHA